MLFRALQGAFGAALAPLSQSVIIDINPRERQGQAMAVWGAGIMIAPIIGPTIGAYLTDHFNWRWVFYINVPVGAAALAGIFLFMPDTVRRLRRFDFLGFALISIAVGSLQLMLDRGAELDWFQSAEVLIELGVAIGAAWMFIVHTVIGRETFLHKGLFTDRNFTASLLFIFVIGIVLLATMALLPPMLQNLFGYPVITVGLVLAPRGIGTMISMMVVGRLVGKVDPRFLVATGLALTCVSLWQMTFFTVDMSDWPIIYSGVIQGFGLGFVFIPLSTVAFQTLDPGAPHRGDGPVQSRAQPRLVDRRLDHGGDADPQPADQPRRAGRLDQPVQPEPRRHRRHGELPRLRRRAADRGATQRPGQRAVADDRLPRRLQADVLDHAFGRAAAPAPALQAHDRPGACRPARGGNGGLARRPIRPTAPRYSSPASRAAEARARRRWPRRPSRAGPSRPTSA